MVLLLGNNRIVLKEFMLWQVCRVFLSIFFFSFNRVEITFAQLKGGRVQIFALYSRGSERAFFDSVS